MAAQKVRKVRLEGWFIKARLSGDDKVTWTIEGQTPKAKGYDHNIEVNIELNFSELECIATQAHFVLNQYREQHDQRAGWVESALRGS